MDFQFTDRVAEQMARTGITAEDVEAVVRRAEWTHTGLASTEYRATLGRRRIGVVVLSNSRPPMVIGLTLIRDGEGSA